MTPQIQSMLDRVLGAGNSTVQVTADLDFDKAVQESTTYTPREGAGRSRSRSSKETYNGTGSGRRQHRRRRPGRPDGRPPAPARGGDRQYNKESKTCDNAVEKTQSSTARPLRAASSRCTSAWWSTPTAAQRHGPADVEDLIFAAVGIDTDRGDTVEVSTMAFDRTADAEAAEELARPPTRPRPTPSAGR